MGRNAFNPCLFTLGAIVSIKHYFQTCRTIREVSSLVVKSDLIVMQRNALRERHTRKYGALS